MHCNISILRDRTAANPNGSDEVTTRIKDGLAATKHYNTTVCLLDRIDVATWLATVLQGIAGDAVVKDRSFGFLLGDVLLCERVHLV